MVDVHGEANHSKHTNPLTQILVNTRKHTRHEWCTHSLISQLVYPLENATQLIRKLVQMGVI